MDHRQGRDVYDVKVENRCLVLQTIAQRPMISRAELAAATGLSKMSMSNIIGELMQLGIVCEPVNGRLEAVTAGRKPRYLDLAETSPCVIGIFISRYGVQVSLGDLRARILWTQHEPYPAMMDSEKLIEMTLRAIERAQKDCIRPILGVGIAAIGPVSTERGTILSPANFFGMHDVPIVQAVREATGYPVFLSSDNMAGAQAEKLFGEGRAHQNFLFLLIWEGIGCGIIVDGRPHVGQRGLGGELGHASICYNGPVCSCGARGCLELYANTGRMAEHVRSRIASGEASMLSGAELNWKNILRAACAEDAAALSAVREYCGFLSCALVNMVNVFDPEIIYLCQNECEEVGQLLSRLIQRELDTHMLAPDCRCVTVRSATFGSNAAVIGSLALVAARVFDGTVPFAADHTIRRN